MLRRAMIQQVIRKRALMSETPGAYLQLRIRRTCGCACRAAGIEIVRTMYVRGRRHTGGDPNVRFWPKADMLNSCRMVGIKRYW
jgi:hypothetical protein